MTTTTATDYILAAKSSPLAASLYAAAGLTWRLLWDHRVIPSHVAVDVDDDGDHWITAVFNQSTAPTHVAAAAVASAARRLDLPEITGQARSFREWNGEQDGRYVNLVLYLPDPPPTWRDRLRRRLPYKASGVAALAAATAAGAVGALAARHALTR